MNVEELMQRAISLADPYKYKTKPNPVVGCLILKDDLIISEGSVVRVIREPFFGIFSFPCTLTLK